MTVYICGDSFGVSDPEYGASWTDILADRFDVVNLCQVAASNLLIARQVDRAIAAKADYIVVLFTSSTRGETVYNNKEVPFSWLTASTITTPFNSEQLRILKEYFSEFHSIDLAIYTNQCIIESVLHRLGNSDIPFVFDQGGFEHASMGVVLEYFADYVQYRSLINLWDFATIREFRPYYHITDYDTHKKIADYYIKKIQ